jgi:hypothetical protein
MTDRHIVTRRHGIVTRALTRARAFYWTSLPAEIRLMILEAITQQKHPGWASLASVCREWQLVIEKRNFHQLKLQASCLDDFKRLIVRQRNLIRHIRLDIELPKYLCRACTRNESISRAGRNSSKFIKGIWKLFRVLSTWEPAKGLTLELNAYSPSDSDHWFKNWYFASDDEGNQDGTLAQQTHSNWHDPEHGWIDGQQVTAPPSEAIQRLFGRVYLDFQKELPQVDSVTCFIIRRQLRRCLALRSLHHVMSKLGRLEHLIYEPWRQRNNDCQGLTDNSRSMNPCFAYPSN